MAEPSESSIASPAVIKVAAPLLFGPVFNWTLYGVLCVQTYVYSYNFPMDKRPVKLLVYFVFLLETVQTALTGADIYYWFIAGFGNVERLGKFHFAPIDVPIIFAVVSLLVQGFFCYRIWVLNKRQSSWVCWIIAVAAVTQLVAALGAGIKELMVEKYVESKTALYVLWSTSSALADVLIVGAMTLLLRRESGNFSNFVLIRVVRLTIETNALTAALAITSLVLYAAFPNELYYAYGLEVVGKAYSNTLLVSLNNRIYLRDHRLPVHGDSAAPQVFDGAPAITLTSLHFAIPESQPRSPKNDTFTRPITPRPLDLDNSSGDDISTE